MDEVQAAQLRPGMYIGDTGDGTGLHNMVHAPLDYAVAEVLGGGASCVDVALYADGSCAVTDDGRGMQVTAADGDAQPFPERLLTNSSFGIRHEVRHKRAQTIQNTGFVPVNALSSWLDLRTVNEGVEYLVRFEFGQLTRPISAVARSDRQLPGQGTRISFLPNASIFKPSSFDAAEIRRTLSMIAETTGVAVTLTDHRGQGVSG